MQLTEDLRLTGKELYEQENGIQVARVYVDRQKQD